MKNVEQEVKSWIEKKIIYIAFIAIFLLGIAVRIMLRSLYQGMPKYFCFHGMKKSNLMEE